MIEKINLKHNKEEYFECVNDLIDDSKSGSQINPVDIFYNRVAGQNKNYEVYVYLIDNKIVATAAIVYEYKLKYIQPKAHIEDVAVHKDYRGKGLGKEIVKACVDIAQKNNCYRIVLTCEDSLIKYYEQLGFTKSNNFMVRT